MSSQPAADPALASASDPAQSASHMTSATSGNMPAHNSSSNRDTTAPMQHTATYNGGALPGAPAAASSGLISTFNGTAPTALNAGRPPALTINGMSGFRPGDAPHIVDASGRRAGHWASSLPNDVPTPSPRPQYSPASALAGSGSRVFADAHQAYPHAHQLPQRPLHMEQDLRAEPLPHSQLSATRFGPSPSGSQHNRWLDDGGAWPTREPHQGYLPEGRHRDEYMPDREYWDERGSSAPMYDEWRGGRGDWPPPDRRYGRPPSPGPRDRGGYGGYEGEYGRGLRVHEFEYDMPPHRGFNGGAHPEDWARHDQHRGDWSSYPPPEHGRHERGYPDMDLRRQDYARNEPRDGGYRYR
jgi:hypothetical protein